MSFSKKQIAFIDAAVKYNETMVAIDLGSVNKTDLQNIANFADDFLGGADSEESLVRPPTLTTRTRAPLQTNAPRTQQRAPTGMSDPLSPTIT